MARNFGPMKWVAAAVALVIGAGAVLVARARWTGPDQAEAAIEQVKPATKANPEAGFRPTAPQWATLTIEPVAPARFRSVLATDGKIAIDDDHTTPIFSPYAGRVKQLMARAGDTIKQGQPLFTVEATDMVQALNDLVAAVAGLNKSKSQLALNQIKYKRYTDLLAAKAAALKDYQEAEANLTASRNDVTASEAQLGAGRNRLRILGKTDAEIADFEKKGQISSETPIFAPLSGTVVQRKVGPGQLVGAGSTDPVFIVGDLSIVWLTANVREIDTPKVRVGQAIEFTVLAVADRVFSSKITYVSTIVDATSRRLLVRAEIANNDGVLKPEMFANVSIVTSSEATAPAVPRGAVIYEGDEARVWVAGPDKSVELRRIKTGLVAGNRVQVLSGLSVDEKIVTKGSLFIDRLAAGNGQ